MEQMNSAPFFFLVLLLPVGLFIRTVIIIVSIFSLSNTAYIGMLFGVAGFGKGRKRIKIIVLVIILLLFFIILHFGVEAFLQNTIFYGKSGIGMEHTTGKEVP